jgi:hypothetical protein
MNSFIKRSAIPASGYVYQNLVGIITLCEWLDTPSLYEWVKFEADDEEAARGLDDIVIQRSDGQMELIQVKFTVNEFEPDYALSWDWLTVRKGKSGTSLLEKWTKAFFGVGPDRAARTELITNRRPDAEFASSLSGGRVLWERLDDFLRQTLAQHAGGEEKARVFFDRFEFSHSYAGHQTLSGAVSAQLQAKHTNHEGWLALYRATFEWSIFKNAPAPDGRITLGILRSTISEIQPRPLDQEFRVPKGYRPPDPAFATDFIEQAMKGDWKCRVLWGSPGQGKSTFLSHFCEQIQSLGVVTIRHHYFLDLQDTSDRFSLASVARSLMSQMESELPEVTVYLNRRPENLKIWLSSCGAACAREGKRLALIVDGLDHVWRENDERISPLNELISLLFPIPQGVTIVLGTQRVGDEQLPPKLHQFVEPEHWVELPRMQVPSITAWLAAHYDSSAFELPLGATPDQTMGALAEALLSLSEGHPLVLTYTFMKMIRDHRVLSAQLVRQSDSAPLGDALAYYKSLWLRLSWDAKDALHLVAEDDFIWPSGALEHCLQLKNVNLEAEIGHLLATVDVGVKAFHGSLYVFIRQQPTHQRRVDSLLPRVEDWLDSEAPSYLRWGWLWLYQSRRGDHSGLLSGTTKVWMLQALVQAFDVKQIIRILEDAEEVAFVSGDYELALRKRALKHRIQNGPEFQIEDGSLLFKSALQLASDPYPGLLMASRVNQSSLQALGDLAHLYLSLGEVGRAFDVQERIRQQIKDRLDAGTLNSHEYERAIKGYLDVVGGTGRYAPDKLIKVFLNHKSGEAWFAAFLEKASGYSDLTPIMAFASIPMPARLRRVLELQAIRVAGWSQAALHSWGGFERFTKHPLSACWAMLYGEPANDAYARYIPLDRLGILDGNSETTLANHLHSLFFAVVASSLQLNGAPALEKVVMSAKREWLLPLLHRLIGSANATATILARGDIPPVPIVYRFIASDRPARNDHDAWAEFRALREALALITADLFLLGRLRSEVKHISAADWAECQRSKLFAPDRLREAYLMRQCHLLSEDTAEHQIRTQAKQIRQTVGPFNEKANELCELCSWATAYGLEDTARELLQGSYEYVTAFGWRKDPGLRHLLDALATVAPTEPEFVSHALARLAPIYNQIDAMTEDSGTSPSDLADLLLQLRPDIFVHFYQHWIANSQWYYADQTFAAFARNADVNAPGVSAALAYASGEQTVTALRARTRLDANQKISAMVRLWDVPEQSARDNRPVIVRENDAFDDSDSQQPMMPEPEDYPPLKLADFLKALDETRAFTATSKRTVEWFSFWEARGKGVELLSALEGALENSISLFRGTELLDLAFELARRLQGPKVAFVWLVRAHQYRYGWSEYYYGHGESQRRLALVGSLYPKRWEEFLRLSTLPIPHYPEKKRAIPDARLVYLLLEVGQTARALSILSTLIDATVAEFECQPLVQPSWWGEGEK